MVKTKILLLNVLAPKNISAKPTVSLMQKHGLKNRSGRWMKQRRRILSNSISSSVPAQILFWTTKDALTEDWGVAIPQLTPQFFPNFAIKLRSLAISFNLLPKTKKGPLDLFVVCMATQKNLELSHFHRKFKVFRWFTWSICGSKSFVNCSIMRSSVLQLQLQSLSSSSQDLLLSQNEQTS